MPQAKTAPLSPPTTTTTRALVVLADDLVDELVETVRAETPAPDEVLPIVEEGQPRTICNDPSIQEQYVSDLVAGRVQSAMVTAYEIPEGEHILHATQLTKLALEWRLLNDAARHDEAMEILNTVIIGCKNMFERLAQHEKFHHSVDLPILVNAASEKMMKWLLRWDARKGTLFSFLSKCARRAFLSEASKQSNFRHRYHVTGDNLEKFFGAEDHAVERREAAAQLQNELHDLYARWSCPRQVGCVRFLVECIALDFDRHDRDRAISGAAFAFAMKPELTKFFYTWALFALRERVYHRARAPFTEQDILRLSESYSMLPDVIDVIGWDAMKQLIITMGGQRIKIPTMTQLANLKLKTKIFIAVDESDLSDPGVEEAGKKAGRKSGKSSATIYAEMLHTLDEQRGGQTALYEDGE
jgi:hypothetical protein